MTNYADLHNPNKTPQREKARKDQVKNYAGGYVFKINPMEQLARFLILGSDAPTYYASEQTLTRENARVVEQCWLDNPIGTADLIKSVSQEGRAPRQNPLIFALALGALSPKEESRAAAYAATVACCRIPTHLFMWAEFLQKLGAGNGPGKVKVFARWLEARDTGNLAYAMVKYQSRHSFNHQRIIHKSNKGAGRSGSDVDAMDILHRRALYSWTCGREYNPELLPDVVQSMQRAMASEDPKVWLKEIEDHNLPWEALPTKARREADIWTALIPKMGLTALIRNLNVMTEVGAIGPMNANNAIVAHRLTDIEELRRARIHPFNVLVALRTYASGKGFKGNKTWNPEKSVVNALDEAFYKSFKAVPPTGQRIMLAVDVSGSMGGSWGVGHTIMNTNITPREAAGAMAMITEKTEPNTMVTAFSTNIKPVDLSSRRRLDDVLKTLDDIPMGGTDCAKPMQYAEREGIPVDTFVIYTDNETWAGRSGHPFQALQNYRRKMSLPNAKLITVAFTSTGFSIADPSDANMLDIVGFDSAAPELMNTFMTSSIS